MIIGHMFIIKWFLHMWLQVMDCLKPFLEDQGYDKSQVILYTIIPSNSSREKN